MVIAALITSIATLVSSITALVVGMGNHRKLKTSNGQTIGHIVETALTDKAAE